MNKYLFAILIGIVLAIAVVPSQAVSAETLPKVAIVPGGDPKPDALLALAEAKLFELKNVALLERAEIDKVLAEQKLSGMFIATNAVELGQILKTDLFAALETTSIVIFDAQTGLRFVDETLPENIETAAQAVADAVTTAVEKRQKLDQGKLITFGVLEVRNADFPVERDAWCLAVAGMLERSLLHRGGAVLERSRLQLVNRERSLTGDGSNNLLASMKLIDLEFTRGEIMQSFKITARIGDKTYLAERPIDKPLDAVQAIAGQLLVSKNVTEISREAEAIRFAVEASVLDKLGLLSDALEKIEVASALQPENIDYRKQLFSSLSKQTSALLSNRDKKFEFDSTMSLYRIDVETMRQCVDNALRLQVLIDSIPSENRVRAPYNAPPNQIHTRLTTLANRLYPDFKNEVRSINRRVLERWLNEEYRPALNRVVNQSTFQSYLYVLHPPEPQDTADLAAAYAEITAHTLRLSHQYTLDEDIDPFDNADTLPLYTRYVDLPFLFTGLMRNFSICVLKCRSDNVSQIDSATAAMIERTLVAMEQDSRLVPQIYAWITRNRPVGDTLTAEQLEEYFNKTLTYLDGLPKGLTYHTASRLYNELTSIVKAGKDFQADLWHLPEDLYGNALHSISLSHIVEIIKLADSRGELARDAVFLYLTVAQKDDKTEYLKIKSQIDTIILRQIVLGENLKDPRITGGMREQAAAAGIIEKPAITEVFVAKRPWKSEVNLFPKEDGYEVYAEYDEKPFLCGTTLYCMLRDRDDVKKRYLGSIHLETYEKHYIFLPHYQGKSTAMQFSDAFQYVDGLNAYFGVHTGVDGGLNAGKPSGLFIYPLDGSEPWTLTTNDGLPSNVIRVLGTLDGQCYAAVEDDWIIRIDLKTRQWKLLSSSRAKEGKTPFVNGRQLKRFFTCTDLHQERILLLVCNVDDGSQWAIEKDGRFVSINESRELFTHGVTGNILLQFSYSSPPYSYDAETDTLSFTGINTYPGCAWNGYIWGNFLHSGGWGRQRIDTDSEIELLAVPEVFVPYLNSGQFRFPRFCISTPDGNGLIVGDNRYLVLLRF